MLHLTENLSLAVMRPDNSADAQSIMFTSFLWKGGEGRVDNSQNELVILPSGIYSTTSLFDLCNKLFDGLSKCYQDVDCLASRAVLTINNFHTEEINDLLGVQFPGNLIALSQYRQGIK